MSDNPSPATPTASLVARELANEIGKALRLDMASTRWLAARLEERLAGPHEWGYRCVTEGTFIKDDAPFEAATAFETLRKALEEIRAVCNPHNSVDESRAVLALRIADAAIEACARAALTSKDHAND